MFAVEQEGVVPDILTVAKGITGGYLPLAATVTTERVFESFLGPYAEQKTFFHGHTYAGNPLACAAAMARMRLFRERRVLEGLPAKVAALTRAPRAARASHPRVGEVRQRGLMVGIELVRDRAHEGRVRLRARAGHQVCPGGAPARRDPPAARERGRAHASARHDGGPAHRALRHARTAIDRATAGSIEPGELAPVPALSPRQRGEGDGLDA